jgi:VanZ family protein
MSRNRIVMLVAYVMLIFTLSTRPNLKPPGPDFHNKDKVAHLIEYGVLGVLLSLALGSSAPGTRWTAFVFLLAIGASVAATDEMVQGMVPGRSKDIFDWCADVVGLAAGISATMRRRPRVARSGAGARSGGGTA